MISVGRFPSALEVVEAAGDHVEVVRVLDPGHVPLVALETSLHVVLVGDRGVPVDRDVVVVVDPAEVGQLLVAREGGGLVRDALHQAAVAGDRVDVEVEQLGALAVEVRRLPLARHGHPDRGRDPLPQRPGRRLDPRGPAVLGVPGALGVELAEVLDVVEADGGLTDHLVVGINGLDPGQEQHRIEQHRCVARREHEAVAVGPDRVGGIEAQVALPERVGQRRQRHRRPGMP